MRKNRSRRVLIALFLLFAIVLCGVFIVYRTNIDIPYLCYSGPAEGIWSIGIYDLNVNGRSIKLHARQGNPLLTAADIKDTPARFVADPFLIQEKDKFYLFFEVLGRGSRVSLVWLPVPMVSAGVMSALSWRNRFTCLIRMFSNGKMIIIWFRNPAKSTVFVFIRQRIFPMDGSL